MKTLTLETKTQQDKTPVLSDGRNTAMITPAIDENYWLYRVKLTEKQALFIEGRLDKFKPTKPEDVEKEFNFYLDSEVDEFGKIAKLMGIEEKAAGGDKGGGTGPEVTPAGETTLNKYLDPAKNPFIKLA
jgi:hypothetical protein